MYHYAGGVVFGALKRWKEAEEFFEIVVTAPGQAAAAIQLEALKKLTLVQLILYGKVRALFPIFALQMIMSMLRHRPFHRPSLQTGYSHDS